MLYIDLVFFHDPFQPLYFTHAASIDAAVLSSFTLMKCEQVSSSVDFQLDTKS